MAKSNLKREQEKQAENDARWLVALKDGTVSAKAYHEKKVVPLETIAEKVRQIGFLAGFEPLKEMNTFNRSFKTQDVGKITTAVAQHMFGKFRAAPHLTNAWNHLIKVEEDPNGPNHYRRRRGGDNVGWLPIAAEIKETCIWAVTVAAGGSLWKSKTKQSEAARGTPQPMFTRQENHWFLTCPLPSVSCREAIIYAIARNYTQDIGIINRICKSKMHKMDVRGTALMHFTNPLFRSFIQLFCENKVTVQEINDLLDYLEHARYVVRDFSLKGRTFASIKKSMHDWHYDLARVERMGDADWSSSKILIEEEPFEVKGNTGVIWNMHQITTSRELAAEGTEQRHCVYSYQAHCISGRTAIWSLTRYLKSNSIRYRALTIEHDLETDQLVQIRGIANRPPRDDEMVAVKIWAAKNGVNISRFA